MRVVRLGSAKAAASELALSPSALSRRVAALEDFTGKRLFTRQHQSMKLTDEGQAFYNAIAPKLEELAEAVEAQIDRGQVLRLHLGVPSLFGGQRLFPRLHIDIETGPNLEGQIGDTLDAAIILTKAPDPSFYSVLLDENRVYAIVSKATAKELGSKPDKAKLSRQTFLIHNDLPESLDAWKAAIGMSTLQPASVDRFDSGQLVLEAAAQGLGIAIMHDDHFRRSHDDRLAVLYDIDVASPYRYCFICRPKDLESRPVKIFHEWLIKADL